MKYLVVGTGGVGGSIAGFLALAGKDVTCIARGKHLDAIRQKGLHLKSDLKGEHFLPVKAYTAEEFEGKADVIFVCVKGYSIDSIKEVLERASTPETLVIPILNVYGTGPRIGRLVPSVHVLDGCIYIVGFVSGEGEITQMIESNSRRTACVRHQSRRIGRHQPRHLHQVGIHLCHGLHRSLPQCAHGRSAARRRGARNLYRIIAGKCRNRAQAGCNLPRRPRNV